MRWQVTLFTIIVMLVLTAVSTSAAAELNKRAVSFTATMNWTGPVGLAVDERLLGGPAGIYVSNSSDCSVKLPTWYAIVGKTWFVVFDPGERLEAGRRYVFWLCYGDVVVEPDDSLATCNPAAGYCNATTVYTNATRLIVDKDYVALEYRSATLNEKSWSDTVNEATNATHTVNGSVYAVDAAATLETPVKQDYYLGYAGVEAKMKLVDTTVYENTTRSYDTGTRYYDTGVYTVYDAGSTIYVTNGSISINVYDSDRDTYYVYLYIDGKEVARWYQRSRVTFDLSGRTLKTVAVRVYDTERNDWVRAYGSIHVESVKYVYRGSVSANRFAENPSVYIRAAEPWSGNITMTATWYNATRIVGELVFSNNTLVYVDAGEVVNASLRAGDPGGMEFLHTAVGIRLFDHPAGRAQTLPPGRAELAASPRAAAASNLDTGDLASLTATEPRRSTRLTVEALAGPPGNYTYRYTELLVFNALMNYTNLYIGPEEPATAQGGQDSGAGNKTIIVNTNPMPEELKLTIMLFSVALPYGLGLFFFYRAIKTNANIYLALMNTSMAVAGIVLFIWRYYDIAKIALALSVMLSIYVIVERNIDRILRALGIRI